MTTTDRRVPELSPARAGSGVHSVVIGLNAVIVTVMGDDPHVLTVRRPQMPLPGAPHQDTDAFGLPFGPFDPATHRTLEIGLREWVAEQTDFRIGYVEQLYTFGNRGRYAAGMPDAPRVVSVGYLALTRDVAAETSGESFWRSWYRFFPWEDWRAGRPPIIDAIIRPRLKAWIADTQDPDQRAKRNARLGLCFGGPEEPWDEERVLERYELLYSAELVGEAVRDRRRIDGAMTEMTELVPDTELAPDLGAPMQFDHRRILATAMGRLRGKLKYRPVVFELMPETFTLSALQHTVEAIAGMGLHKQNFRRLVERGRLVEETGTMTHKTGGRPAALFRFRQEVVREHIAPGVRISRTR